MPEFEDVTIIIKGSKDTLTYNFPKTSHFAVEATNVLPEFYSIDYRPPVAPAYTIKFVAHPDDKTKAWGKVQIDDLAKLREENTRLRGVIKDFQAASRALQIENLS